MACVLASHTDVRAAVVRIYDSRDRNIERVSTNHGTGTDYYYDTDNRLAAAEDQDGSTTIYGYNAVGSLAANRHCELTR
ncbi:hypothetical protein [Ereboglobus sp. PH5-5]|uniref:hypothetical protein n=1 Tax=Ereboglobus sp. PH5-5 TaxID=2940529 RepID=UPI0024053684|nr:hypothetical protein [Ereboglobus sp. PH5-5]